MYSIGYEPIEVTHIQILPAARQKHLNRATLIPFNLTYVELELGTSRSLQQ